MVAPPSTNDKFSSFFSEFSLAVTNVDIPNFFKNSIELLGPTSAIILTLIVFAENPIPCLTVTKLYPLCGFGVYPPEKVVLDSSYTVAAVIIPDSSAGAIAANGFIAEPGCLVDCVALFCPFESTSSPSPPMHPTTLPVLWSITTIAD